ncbi:GNAT family N-acetyltransferase [Chitinophaga vietnamensis]|uniref:GNAT family N-acetyltransferase n=1 Tax=Chitinophaga vietnamensis TaxID=2593957 RepID=UPI00117857CA|nr:GNAT family N-acetyltransferase [Chitinophaga vietnamensis]
MSVSIRKAGPEDFPALYDVIREFADFQQSADKLHITPAQLQADKDIFQCLLAVDGDTIIGYATYFFAYYSWSGKALYLDDLYVKEAWRGQQTGTRLLREIIAMGKEAHCKKVRWQVSRWNAHAIGFYKAMGATVDDVELNCDYHFS